jgi:alpha-L-fucosidase
MVARYEPTWESLGRYSAPQWYEDAKFGIFIHWGVYSVPAFGNEWYPRQMYLQGTPEFAHHVATYGPQDRFGYKDFIPQFTGARFDATQWADLFARAGAKFVVPVAEHHDGFPLYDTALSEWSAAHMGPRRDVVGELAQAVRQQGMVFGVSSHRAEHWWFFNGGRSFPSDVQDDRYAGLYGPAVSMPGFEGHDFEAKPWPDQAFLDDWLARCVELVDKYRPQLIWFDWWINHHAFVGPLRRFAAHYYNRGLEWDLGVAINHKFGAMPEGTAVLDIERGQLAGIRPLLWQNDTSVSKNSWGYVAQQDYKTARDLIGDLVDVVSKNGALLLNIGPRPDGTIPEPEQALLLEIGDWLRTNGEAIYGTRPWTVFGEGPTVVEEGSFADTKRAPFTGRDFRFTRKDNRLFAIALDWPGASAAIESLGLGSPHCPGRVTQVRLLGHQAPLAFTQDDAALHVTLPPQPVGRHAYAFEVRY